MQHRSNAPAPSADEQLDHLNTAAPRRDNAGVILEADLCCSCGNLIERQWYAPEGRLREPLAPWTHAETGQQRCSVVKAPPPAMAQCAELAR